jgi:flagellar motor protein MotB
MEALLWSTFPVNDADFQTLAAARAQSVQAYLLQTGKVEASRVFLTASGAEHLRHDGSRAYLQFR